MPSTPIGKQPRNCFIDRKSPFWQYDFAIAGRRERGSTRERTAAKAAAYVEGRKAVMRKTLAEEAMGIAAPKARPIGLYEACDRYEAHLGKADKTTQLQIGNLCALLCPDGRDRMLRDIGTADFADYRATRGLSTTRRGTMVTAATINREVELARRVWLYAAGLDLDVGKMPNWSKVIIKSAECRRNRELRSDEEQRLFAALRRINPDLALMAEFAMLTGQRKRAVVRLRWSDINFALGEARFELKTRGEHKRINVVPLSSRMLDIIKQFEKVGPYVFTYVCQRAAPRRGDRPTRVKGERFPFSVQGWTRQWRAALNEADVQDFRWHDLRHTAASRLLRTVPNLKMVQELLGHCSIDQTARYAHINKEGLREALEQVDSRSTLRAVA